jgi:hypothetical protein
LGKCAMKWSNRHGGRRTPPGSGRNSIVHGEICEAFEGSPVGIKCPADLHRPPEGCRAVRVIRV